MKVTEFPKEWEILLEYDSNGKITGCYNLYSLMERNPLKYESIDKEEKESLMSKLLHPDVQDNSDFEDYKIIKLGSKILNDSDSRKMYNTLYARFYGDNLAKHYIEKAKALTQQGSLEAAIKHYEKAINYGKNDLTLLAEAWNNKGEIHENFGEVDKAKNCYQESVKKDDENIDALINLGEAYLAQEKYVSSKKYFLKAIDKKEDSVDALNGIIGSIEGENLIKEKQIENCKNQSQRAKEKELYEKKELELRGIKPPAYRISKLPEDEYNLCLDIGFYINEGKSKDKAKAAIKLLKTINPKSAEAYYYEAKLLWNEIQSSSTPLLVKEVLKVEKAIKSINKSLKLDKEYKEGWDLKQLLLKQYITINNINKTKYVNKLYEVQSQLERRIEEEFDESDLQGIKEPETLEAVLAETFEVWDKTKSIAGCIKRHFLYGFLPAEDQKKAAEENDEDARDYTTISCIEESVLGLSALTLGVFSYNPYLISGGLGLVISACCRDYLKKNGDESGDKEEVAGSPILGLPWYIQNQIKRLKRKWQIKVARRILEENKEVKLLEERCDDEFETEEIDSSE